MQIDVNDPVFVLWLQQSLARVLLGHAHLDPTGEFDPATRKAVLRYQIENKLPQTDLDEAIVARIKQDLAVLDSQPYKKKRRS
jgi:peptidoglycan hydrolase-like protein with peptidoglycan-binding domain